MTAPDYPHLAIGGYETYQLAHIAAFVADRLARHRVSGRDRDGRRARAAAVRDLAAAATALDARAGTVEPMPRAEALPRPLDLATYRSACNLVGEAPRSADVVSTASLSGSGWAVVGHVPGIGAVGAATATREMAEAIRTQILTRPLPEIATWTVRRAPTQIPTLPGHVDLAAFASTLDPQRAVDRAVAAALRGIDRRTDLAIAGRFVGIDLDGVDSVRPAVVRGEAVARAGRTAQPAATAAKVPNTSAGP